MKRLPQTLLLFALVATLAAPVSADEFPSVYDSQKIDVPLPSPQAALKMISVPQGFKVSLFAAEPDIQQPIGATTDARGRLWVCENYTYAESGKNFDVKLRDRIVILEDVDGDGRFDKRTVFWDEGVKLTSVAVGFGGAWALCSPNLLFIPDKNGDDVPDGPPKIVLDGWDADSVRHNIVNGLKWGPDGWLYGLHGILATSLVGKPGAAASQRQKINCGVWRYHPRRELFEVVAEGTTNPWGLDYDEHGEMFMINTVIGHLWHVVPGARYRRMYGAHFNPYTYQVIEQTADHFHWDAKGEAWNDIRKLGVTSATDRKGGGHAHTGLMIYQGGSWPAKYHNTLFTANLHGRRLNNDRLERQGNSFVGKHNADLFHSKDPWFRGIELLSGRDGGVFVLDWSDIGECHENDGVHRTSGRIYKITYGSPKSRVIRDVSKLNGRQLARLQRDANDWYVRQARRLLQERAAAGADVSAAAEELSAIYGDAEADVKHRLRAMWCLYGIGVADEPWLLEQTYDEDERVRSWAVRLLCDLRAGPEVGLSAAVRQRFLEMSREDDSSLVRLYLASALRRMTDEGRIALADGLMARVEDAGDRMQPLLIWYGLEPAVARRGDLAQKLVGPRRIGLVRRNIVRRLVSEIHRQPAASAALVERLRGGDESLQNDILEGMAEALRGWRKAPPPDNWKLVAAELSKTSKGRARQLLLDLGVVFGDGRAIDDLRRIARDGKADAESRRQAVRTLSRNPSPDLFPLLKALVGDRLVNQEVVAALARCDDPSVPRLIFGQYSRLHPEGQAEAINTLTARPDWSLKLLDAVEQGRVDRGDIGAWHARQMNSFGDRRVSQRLAKVWGEIRESSAERKKQIESLRGKLTGSLADADLSQGRRVFAKNCAACHSLYGAGGNTGPDLTGSNRKNLQYLLENIVDPSASVAANFRTSSIRLADGVLVTGVVVQTTERTIVVQTQKERKTIDREEIEEMKQTDQSLMPDGLLKTLSPADVSNLFAYLMGDAQPPLPK